MLATSQKTSPCHSRPSTRSAARARPGRARCAARSGRRLRLPATSCAEPGRSRVITISVMARRKRTRAARSSARETRTLAVVRPGGRNGWHRDASLLQCWGRVVPLSITSHTGHRRPDAPSRSAGLSGQDRPATRGRTTEARRGAGPSRPHGSVSRMADRPRGNGGPEDGTPEYNWLYGRKGKAGPSEHGDPDATRVVPRQPRPDETRVMPTVPRGQESSRGRPASRPANRPAGRPSPPPPAPPAPRRRRGSARRAARAGRGSAPAGSCVLFLLWVVFLVAVPIFAWTKVAKVDACPDGDRPDDQPGTTYLLVGSDSRAGLSRRGAQGPRHRQRRRAAHRHDHAAAHRQRARTC